MNDYKYNFYNCTDNYFDSAFTPLGVSRHTAYQLLGINYSGSIHLKLVPKFKALLFLLFYIYIFFFFEQFTNVYGTFARVYLKFC